MRALKFILPLWCALIFYSVCALTFGPGGLSALAKLEKEKDALQKNIDAINLDNAKLSGLRDSLKNNRQALSEFAHELGYSGAGEKFIRINGLPPTKKTDFQPPAPYIPQKIAVVSNRFITAASLTVGILAALAVAALSVFDYLKYLKKHGFRRATRSPMTGLENLIYSLHKRTG